MCSLLHELHGLWSQYPSWRHSELLTHVFGHRPEDGVDDLSIWNIVFFSVIVVTAGLIAPLILSFLVGAFLLCLSSFLAILLLTPACLLLWRQLRFFLFFFFFFFIFRSRPGTPSGN